jgi:hypothetical protein
MKTTLLALAALGMMTGSALAVPVTGDQQADFYKTCMGIAQNDTLCSCKRDAAPKLIDADFMAIVISAMKGRTPDPKYTVTYDQYIAQSNAVCIPGY